MATSGSTLLRSPVRTWTWLTAPALVAVVAGCAGDANIRSAEEHAPSATDATSQSAGDTSGAPRARSVQARRAFAQALRPMMRERVTWFRAETTVAGTRLMLTEGFAVAATGWKATTTFTLDAAGSKQRVMLTRATEGSVWMQMKDWTGESAGCWLAMSPTEVPLGVAALSPVEPQYISVLGGVEPVGYDGSDTVAAEMSITHVLMLLTTKLQEPLGLTESDAREPVEVVVGLRDGRVADLRVEGADLVSALDAVGATLDGDLRGFVEALSVELDFPVREGEPRVSPPAGSLRTAVGDSGCH